MPDAEINLSQWGTMEGNLSLWSHLSPHQLDHMVKLFLPYLILRQGSQSRVSIANQTLK